MMTFRSLGQKSILGLTGQQSGVRRALILPGRRGDSVSRPVWWPVVAVTLGAGLRSRLQDQQEQGPGGSRVASLWPSAPPTPLHICVCTGPTWLIRVHPPILRSTDW